MEDVRWKVDVESCCLVPEDCEWKRAAKLLSEIRHQARANCKHRAPSLVAELMNNRRRGISSSPVECPPFASACTRLACRLVAKSFTYRAHATVHTWWLSSGFRRFASPLSASANPRHQAHVRRLNSRRHPASRHHGGLHLHLATRIHRSE